MSESIYDASNNTIVDLSEAQFEAVIFDIDGTLSDCEHRRHLVAAPLYTCVCGKSYPTDTSTAEHFRCDDPGPLSRFRPDWDAFFDGCDQDPMNVPVVLLARMLHMMGYRIILVTGRPERVREKTAKWLADRDVPYHVLMMRKDGDHRPDDELKRLALTNNIEKHMRIPRERILCVFDDRESVVKMWRDEGLTVCQVAEGKF